MYVVDKSEFADVLGEAAWWYALNFPTVIQILAYCYLCWINHKLPTNKRFSYSYLP